MMTFLEGFVLLALMGFISDTQPVKEYVCQFEPDGYTVKYCKDVSSSSNEFSFQPKSVYK